jgi:hypothetical protein
MNGAERNDALKEVPLSIIDKLDALIIMQAESLAGGLR